LTDEPQSAKELARATGRGRGAVQKALKALAAYALAENDGGAWKRGPSDVGEVAREFNAEERASLRRARHERQREAFREFARLSANRRTTEKGV